MEYKSANRAVRFVQNRAEGGAEVNAFSIGCWPGAESNYIRPKDWVFKRIEEEILELDKRVY